MKKGNGYSPRNAASRRRSVIELVVAAKRYAPLRAVAAAAVACAALLSCGGTESADIKLVKASHLSEFPNATLGEMMERLFESPDWKETTAANGSIEVDVSGELPVTLAVVLSPDRTKVVSARLRINGAVQPAIVLDDLLSHVYGPTDVGFTQLLGRWVNEESYQRMLYLRPDGTFHMHSWPWDFGGEYHVAEPAGKLVLHPKPPLDPSVPATELDFSFSDPDHLLITDPDADLLLVSTPLEFQRQ